MKKFNKFILLFALLLSNSSCKKYLTVNPASETTKESLFTSTQGYTDALVGIYIDMRKNYSPASFMVNGGIEYMAQLWYSANLPNNSSYQLLEHNYTATEADALLSTMFLNQYNVLANINTLLGALSTQTILETRVAKVVEGEVLALRAFNQFDLIRVFGPMPKNIGSKAYLPYVTTVSKNAYTYDTYTSYMSKLLADLDKAEPLLLAYDPIVKYSPYALNTTYASQSEYSSMFWYYRQNRMNYYAVLGLKARVYLWMGDKVNALKYAQMVVNAVNTNGTSKFTFGVRANLSTKNYVFFTEHLFGLNVPVFDDSGMSSGSLASNVTPQTRTSVDLYQNVADLRTSLFYSVYSSAVGTTCSSTKKYAEMTTVGSTSPFTVPLIRLSEMYLIISECAPLADANSYFATYRTAKEANAITLTDANLETTLLTEYIKEFYGEGQSFYAYKRFGTTNMLWADHTTADAQYVVPLPSKETGN
ncbi:MAG: RagB/SusD family nutrient uptake outer membrane protein [Mucilaginibacter sp.]|nr:RagB/SusD family nutrient uptake outer membrane protein [Mucilaginibacter sp.]